MQPNQLIYNHKFHFNAVVNSGVSIQDSFEAALADGASYEAFVYNPSSDVTVRAIIDTLEIITEGEDPWRASQVEVEIGPQDSTIQPLGLLRDRVQIVLQNVGTNIPTAFDVTVKIRAK